ncbi:transglutaminase family protein [Rhodobacter sp. NTK016B]|uniref:transglutaminase family protein n=1 Tax=Rhodobacter sp. NTK016B TaxID=2759676 RepID=UPI001A8D426E|nr:transglutaminase family protein [Rhodobacter sp. NTK016B]MBN8293901.1 transglutaminase family protein [Rhodobacter sp. NTK016B]
MKLTVEHVTTYIYDQPVRGVVQSHRLLPTQCLNQSVQSWNVTVSDGMMGGSFRDGAGDYVQGWTVTGPVDRIEVRVTGSVTTTDCAGVLRGNRELLSPIAWLGETGPTIADGGLKALAAKASGETGLALAHDLSAKVSGAIAYTPGATDAHTTAAEALEQGQGVCQDHAHALIACARARGMPARYVSGYLFTDSDGKSHEAAHAWAEIWIDGLGWVGFDPANECCPDERYIRLGCGADAEGAAPIRGIARGPGSETMEIAVAIASAQQ